MAAEDPCEFGPHASLERADKSTGHEKSRIRKYIKVKEMRNMKVKETYKSKRDEEKRLIRKGYDQTKEKVKNI